MPPIVYFLLCLFIAIFGRKRKFGFWGYLFGSLFLSPIIGFLLVISSDQRIDLIAEQRKAEKKLAKEQKKLAKKRFGFFRKNKVNSDAIISPAQSETIKLSTDYSD